MLDRIRAFFESRGEDAGAGSQQVDGLQVAAAALLIEAARLDAHVDAVETDMIRRLVRRRFALSEDETDRVIALAEREVEGAVELYGFARRVKDEFSHDERVELMEMMWRVAYADGVLDDLEASLMRRIAGLLFVTDRESGMARKRARAALGQTG